MNNECINANLSIVLDAIEKYLQDLHFPASKQDIINQAQKNNASEDLLMLFEIFLDKYYDDSLEVAIEFNNILQTENNF